jgi:pyruvate dehydrogenase E2 component (dihydrolipoamide acetyltransferase)
MATFDFLLPDIGEGVVEGEIVKWLVKAGDVISEDQPMVEVMTDKATVTIPSPKRGKVLKTFGKEGEIAKVHAPLVSLELDGAGAATRGSNGSSGHAASPRPSAPKAPAPRQAQGDRPALAAAGAKVLATPVTRRMAREHGIDLASLAGTGPQGRVLKVDVEAAMSGGGRAAAASTRPTSAPVIPLISQRGDERIPIRGLRKKIAEKMVKAKFTAPHYTFVEEIDASGLVDVRSRLNAQLKESGEEFKISFLPFFCKALVGAFKEFPQVNANMDEATQELVVRGEYNIGIAAATEAGLTVPVVKQVDRLPMRALAQEISRLGEAARTGKLKMDELTGGGFTITSLGQTGGLFATPIINHPEVAIMGVHRMRKRPVVEGDDDKIVVKPMMYLSFSFDHRVIDGAVGADFAYAVIRRLEKPELLFLEMA